MELAHVGSRLVELRFQWRKTVTDETLTFMDAVFNALPDVVSFLFAMLGVAIGVWPEEPARLRRRTALRVGFTLLLIILGGLAIRSSYIQRDISERKQKDLRDSVSSLENKLAGLQQTVSTYGTKLDQIIADPKSSSGQRIAAQSLKNNIIQDAEQTSCSNMVIGGDAKITCPPAEKKSDRPKASDNH
jgi:hypothetical protein